MNSIRWSIPPCRLCSLWYMIEQDAASCRQVIDQMAGVPNACQWGNQLTSPEGFILDHALAEEVEILRQTYAPDMQSRHGSGIYRRLAPMLRNDQRHQPFDERTVVQFTRIAGDILRG